VLPVSNVQRNSSSQKKNVAISQPTAITNYNINMGGTDRMDQNVISHMEDMDLLSFRRSIAMGYQRQYGTPKSRPSLTAAE
ncbi:hypothetical protein ANN_04065, partial [Periplaneta americana]